MTVVSQIEGYIEIIFEWNPSRVSFLHKLFMSAAGQKGLVDVYCGRNAAKSEIRHALMGAIFHFAENRSALFKQHWKFVFSAVSGQHTTGNYCLVAQKRKVPCMPRLRLLSRGIKSRLSVPWFLLHAQLCSSLKLFPNCTCAWQVALLFLPFPLSTFASIIEMRLQRS